MVWIQRQNRLAGDAGQTLNAFLSTRGALVEGRLPFSDGLGVSRAIGKAATRALGLRQRRQHQVAKGLCAHQALRRAAVLRAGLAVTEAFFAATRLGLTAALAGLEVLPSCSRMKARTCGYTTSRQRRPLKMP